MAEELSALLHEHRRYPPAPEFAASATAQPGIHEEAAADPTEWWESQARRLDWAEPWTRALEWDPPFAKWFVGRAPQRCRQLRGSPHRRRPE